MTINGQQKLVRGGVLFALADTPAAHSLAGFKVGVSFALRKCRMCLATQSQLSTKASFLSYPQLYVNTVLFDLCIHIIIVQRERFHSKNTSVIQLPLHVARWPFV